MTHTNPIHNFRHPNRLPGVNSGRLKDTIKGIWGVEGISPSSEVRDGWMDDATVAAEFMCKAQFYRSECGNECGEVTTTVWHTS